MFGNYILDYPGVVMYNQDMESIINIQDKQIAAELAAIRKHGNNNTVTGRKVILSARTRAANAFIAMGFDLRRAKEMVTDAADMVALEMEVRS